jgi:hypothetical protein
MSQSNGTLVINIPHDATDPVAIVKKIVNGFIVDAPVSGLSVTIDVTAAYKEAPVNGPSRFLGNVVIKDGAIKENNVHPLETVPEYMAKIRQWATDRNIIGGGSTDLDQLIKGLTEAGEFWTHIGKRQYPLLKDDIGDIIVCLVNSVGCLDINLEDYVTVLNENERVSAKALYRAKGLKRFSLQVLYGLTNTARYIEQQADYDAGEADSESEMHGFILADVAESAADVVYTLETVALEHGWTLAECLHEAYYDIWQRKGLMVQGTFVKESDFTREMVEAALADPSTKPTTRIYLTDWLNK